MLLCIDGYDVLWTGYTEIYTSKLPPTLKILNKCYSNYDHINVDSVILTKNIDRNEMKILTVK